MSEKIHICSITVEIYINKMAMVIYTACHGQNKKRMIKMVIKYKGTYHIIFQSGTTKQIQKLVVVMSECMLTY